MVEPITLAAVGTVALTEGIKFLYTQTGEVLKRWRERRDASQPGTADPDNSVRMEIELPDAFEGHLSEPQIHFDVLQQLEEDLREARKSLSDYAEGIENVDTRDKNLLARTDALRRLLEAVLQERITLKGEQRPPSGPLAEGHIDADEVAGYAAAVRARRITGGRIVGRGTANRVEPGGKFIGIDADEIKDER